MRFSLTTWNINSVRLRIDLVAKFLKSVRPDVLCLQETKCIDDAFPLKRFRRLGYEHVALNGQKGYHGVAVVSRLPFETTNVRAFCDKIDSRHISVVFGDKAQLAKPLVLHNLYVPAGGDIPDPALNPKFEHKLRFLDEMKSCEPRDLLNRVVDICLFEGSQPKLTTELADLAWRNYFGASHGFDASVREAMNHARAVSAQT